MADSQRDINELLAKAAQYRNAAKKALEDETKEIIKQKGISEELARIEARKTKAYKEQADSLKEIVSQVNEAKRVQKENIETLISQEKSLKGLTGLQASLVEQDRRRIQILSEDPKIRDNTKSKLDSIASLNKELLDTSAEDAVTRDYLQRTIQKELKGLRGLGKAGAELASIEEEKFQKALSVSSLTEHQQKMLNQQLDAYDAIKNTVGGIFDTLSLLTSGPLGFLGTSLIVGGVAGKKLLDTSYELGGSLLDTSNISTTLFGTVFPNAVETTKSLSSEFGGLADVSLKTQLRTNVLAKNLGIGAGEAAKLTGSFARLNDGSAETAQNLIQSTKNLAEQNGLVPSAVMADVANSAETFALFGKDGGKNIAEAAVAAGKLGVSMSQIAGVADNLLDFESSINAELELGAMLGRNINLDRARALAYEGDIGGSVRETLSALGGIEEFNKMDYFQKKQTAALLGVSVDEFQKMADNADKLGKNGEIQVSQYEKLANNAKAFGSQILSAGQAMGGMLMATGQMKQGLSGLGNPLSKIKSAFGGGASAAGPLTKAGKPDMRFNANKGLAKTAGGGGIGGMMKGMGGGLKGLAKGIGAFANPATLLGLAAVTAAIIGIGFALKVAAPGIEAFGKAIGNIITSVGTAVATIFGGLGDFFGKIAAVATPELALSVLGLAGGFAALTASLIGFSVAGIAAIPAMMAVSAFGAASSLLGLGGEGGAGGDSDLLGEIRGLREDLNNGKVAVYLDGKKVTAGVARVANASSFNSYSSN
jgi:hypothetical protein